MSLEPTQSQINWFLRYLKDHQTLTTRDLSSESIQIAEYLVSKNIIKKVNTQTTSTYIYKTEAEVSRQRQ